MVPLVGLTTLQSMSDQDLKIGEHVLVLGASGGTGHFAVQVAKAKGARVTAVCGSSNMEFVKGLGADVVIDYTQGDVLDALRAEVSHHGPFDLVFDSVSSHDPRDSKFTYEQRIRAACPKLIKGNYVFIGGLVNDWLRAHVKRFCGIFTFGAGRELFWVRFPYSWADLEHLKTWCENGALKPVLYRSLPFTEENVREAFRLQMNRRVVGKLVLDFNSLDATCS